MFNLKTFSIKRNIDNISKGESNSLTNNTIYYVIITAMINYSLQNHTILCTITLLRYFDLYPVPSGGFLTCLILNKKIKNKNNVTI